jgi:hypothetical protein
LSSSARCVSSLAKELSLHLIGIVEVKGDYASL